MNRTPRPDNSDNSAEISATPQATPRDEPARPLSVPQDSSTPFDTNVAATSWPSTEETSERTPQPINANPERATMLNGCFLGLILNVVLGYMALALMRQGVPVYGPALVAMTLGAGLLLLVVKPWPRRTQLFIGSCLGGLLLGFCAIWLLIRPLATATVVETSPPTPATSSASQPSAPAAPSAPVAPPSQPSGAGNMGVS
jgi:hypothetical protein